MRPRSALVAAASLLVLGLSGCGSGTPDSPAADAGRAGPATGSSGSEPSGDDTFGGNWLATASEAFAGTQDPELDYELTSATAVTFHVDNGETSTSGDAISKCQIALGAIGQEYVISMAYPDATVRCNDMLG